MRKIQWFRFLFAAGIALSTTVGSGCSASHDGAQSASASDGGKIPITTRSEDARKEFLEGRALADKLLAQDSLQHFDKAISLDPEFASAELARANASPTAKDFFDHLNKAVNLADKASEGERLLILANQAGANADAIRQEELLQKLVAAFPNDERAHFTLGGYYFGQQDLPEAIAHYKTATELSPSYSTAYNLLGYAYRQQSDYTNAEQAFKKYVELIPNDPNPYDSYAELLLKMGRYDDSIAQYRKALAIDPHFFASHFGIAADLMYQGKAGEAAAELQKITENARNDGERRTAMFGETVVAADAGQFPKALKDMDDQYALGAKANDVAAMAADLQAKGNIFAEMQKYDDAKQQFDRLLQITETSTLSQEIKDNAKRFHHYNLTVVAIGKRDFGTAKSESDQFREAAEESRNPIQIKLAHELAGRIALARKDFDGTITELQQANQQDPQNLYRLCQAYQGKGDTVKAHEFCGNAAGFNSLPQLNYAFVRAKAQKMAGKA